MKTKYKLNRRQAAWVAALRSGKYKQTKSALRDNDGFCCLGVACDLAVARKWVALKVRPNNAGVFTYGDKIACLPSKVKRALGFREHDGEFDSEYELGGEYALDAANDRGVSFRRIATFCEKHPEAVFTKKSLIKIAPKKRAK